MNLSSLPSRPFQIIVFGVFILLAIVGLALFASYSGSNGGGAKIGTVTIWGILPTDAVQGQLDALKTTNKEYGAVNYVQKPADSFDATLANAIASGAGPDMVLISQEQLLAEQSKLVVIPFSAIPQRTYLDTFVPIDELYLTDKGTYGVPFAVDPLVLYYNRSLLSSAGVAAPPATWEAVTGLAPRLTQKTNGQLIKSGIALGDYANIPSARAIVSLLLFQSGSPIASLSSNGTIQAALTGNPSGDSFGVTPAESAMGFYTQFADPAKTVYSWNRALINARQAFISGDLALYIGYASEAPFLSAANPNLDFDMAKIPQPATSQTRMTYGEAYAFAIPKATRNYNGALATARILANKDIATASAHALGMAPAQRALLIPSADDRYQAIYYPEALVAKGWLSPLPATTDSIFAAMIGNITSGSKSVRDALDTADQSLNAAL